MYKWNYSFAHTEIYYQFQFLLTKFGIFFFLDVQSYTSKAIDKGYWTVKYFILIRALLL